MATRTDGSKASESTAVSAPEEITSTVAQNDFAELLNRIAYKGDRFVISRHGKRIAQLIPIEPTG